ncbi:MAG: LPS assembly lipoprotein LptE [Planctomycetota bacterium]
MRLFPLLLLLLTPASCGYQMVQPDLGGGRSVSVPTSENRSRWYGIEADLTRELRADLQRQLDVRLASDDADLTLQTEILDVGRRSRVALRSGGAAIGTSELGVAWSLKDAAGNVLGEGVIRRNLEFLTALEEDAYDAFDEMFVEISQQVAMEVGAALEADAKLEAGN